jgi:hypothetical protein
MYPEKEGNKPREFKKKRGCGIKIVAVMRMSVGQQS